MTGELSISIIIPVLNEERQIAGTLASLTEVLDGGIEVIVADGGSQDRTVEIAKRFEGMEVIESGLANRGAQMNAGASIAHHDVLLFLHADVKLPSRALTAIRLALSDDRVSGGCFELRFPVDERRSLHLVASGINLRTRLFRTATGDQAIFVRRSVFTDLGGFEPLPLMEDIQFFNRLKRFGRVAILPEKVEISPRRWIQRGVWRTVLLMYALRFGYWLGFSPARLKRYFLDVR